MHPKVERRRAKGLCLTMDNVDTAHVLNWLVQRILDLDQLNLLI